LQGWKHSLRTLSESVMMNCEGRLYVIPLMERWMASFMVKLNMF